MLVLMRRPDEEIVITTPAGEEIVVKVTKINGKQAHIGIQAAKEIKIQRSEIIDRTEVS